MRRWVLLIALLVACGTESQPASTPESTLQPTPEATPEPTPDDVAVMARAVLGAVVDREAGDPANAWALAHGILARGPGFEARDGRLAVAVLAQDFLEEEAGGPGFPTSRGDVRVEPHTDLILKTLVEAGLPLDEPLAPEKPTLRELLDASQGRFVPQRQEGQSLLSAPNDAPWSVQAWCQAAAAGGSTTWSGATLEEVSGALLGVLEKETWFIRQAMAAGETVEKKKQDIFAYTCGGAHLFQGAVACAAAGQPSQGNTPARIDALVDIYLYRLPLETQLVDATLVKYPQLAPILHNQDIKFLGHLLEGLGKAERDGLWTPTEAERAALAEAEAKLLADVIELKRRGIYEAAAMQSLASNEETFQFYLDLVGDACHALSGLAIQEELRR